MSSTTHRSASLAFGVALFALSMGLGPCGPIPGGALSGDLAQGPIDDWSFANEVPRCAVEVRPESPHSVTVNCMSWQGELFVSCSECEGKRWSGYALANPDARIRIGGALYPVTLRRVEDPARLDQVWKARARKLGKDETAPRPAGWWTFRLTSR